jgi:transposase-like protein
MTSSTEPGVEPTHELLKVDSRGRIQISPERRSALLEEFDRSGMTGTGFARHYGIKYTTFAHWIRQRKIEHVARATPEKFLLVTSEPRTNTKSVLIHLPNGASLSVADTAQAELAGAIIRSLGNEH